MPPTNNGKPVARNVTPLKFEGAWREARTRQLWSGLHGCNTMALFYSASIDVWITSNGAGGYRVLGPVGDK